MAVLRRKKPYPSPALNRFADFIADLNSIKLASQAMGISEKHGAVLMGRIRQRMGWQAR